jgi:hypothetical protein
MLDRKTTTWLVKKHLGLCVSTMFLDDWESHHDRECDALIEAYLQGERLAALQIDEMAQLHLSAEA